MPIINAVGIWIDNIPGGLAKVSNTLGKAKINVEGISITPYGGRIIVDDPTRAIATLTQSGISAWNVPSLAIESDDTPGALGRITGALAEHGINIDEAYIGTSRTPGKANVILGVSDIGAASRIEKQIR
jgi:hypothetical protein